MKILYRIVFIILSLAIIGALLVYKFVYNKPHKDISKARAEYTLTAEQLYREFTSDSKTATDRYAGKVIEISGIPENIEEADTLSTAVFVFGESEFGVAGVRCTLMKDEAIKVKERKKETVIRLKGLCQGFNDTDVILEKGSLLE